MLRFILRRKTRDNESGLEGEGFYTIDADVPELERALGSGGIGHQGYDVTELIGVEQLEDAQGDDNGR